MNNKFLRLSSKLLQRQLRDLTTSNSRLTKPNIVVFGGSILDVNYRVLDDNLELNGGSYKSNIEYSCGGVARNLAESLYKLYGNVQLITAFGEDSNGITLKKSIPDKCLEYSVTLPDHHSATCAIILDKTGESRLFVGDMFIHEKITADHILKHKHLCQETPLIVMDSNLSIEAIETILKLAKEYKKPVFFEPTDVYLAKQPFELPKELYQQIKFISPNLQELKSIAKFFNVRDVHTSEADTLNDICKICLEVQKHVENILVSMGDMGVFISSCHKETENYFDENLRYKNDSFNTRHYCRHYPVKKEVNIQSASGAGDAFCSGFITSMLKHLPENVCVSVGFQASREALHSKGAVPDKYFLESHECWKSPAKYDLILDNIKNQSKD
jgi:pseudouridine-5'-phosphate glycosidase/pseudouridine kinase